jgi:hypothetical protein
MKYLFSVIIFSVFISAKAQNCDVLTLDQEIQLTQNIALVRTGNYVGDSIEVSVIKKWKGDSISDHFLVLKETLFSDYILFDSIQTYMLFWYNNLPVNKCSRTSEYKFVHFEYLLDIKFNGGELLDIITYDSIKYRKYNIFTTVKGKQYDRSKANYSFYDLQSNSVQPFEKLPKETSYHYPIRFYEVDSNIKTFSTTFVKVFAVDKSNEVLPVTNKIKKDVLIGIYK